MEETKFWSLLQVQQNGCWLWSRVKDRYGYGRVSVGGRAGKMERVHRYAYMLAKGPIPEGMLVCHSCDVRHCCNPDHLWLGTNADNMRDRDSKGRRERPLGSKNGQAKLTDEQRTELVRMRLDGQTFARIGEVFGMNPSSVWETFQNHRPR